MTESRQCYRSGSTEIMREMLMGWHEVWRTVGQASSRL